MNYDFKTTCGKTVKIAGGLCAATGVVALSAVVASGAALGAVVEGFKAARRTMAEIVEKEVGIRKEEARETVPVQTEQKVDTEIMEEPEIEPETQGKADTETMEEPEIEPETQGKADTETMEEPEIELETQGKAE